MADRFPKIEDLDLTGEPSDQSTTEGSFLDRERQALGEDAGQFVTDQDSTTAPSALLQQDGDEDDLLGGGNDDTDFGATTATSQPTAGSGMMRSSQGEGDDMDFEKSFPAIDTRNEAVAPGGKITGSAGQDGSNGHDTAYTASSYDQEPEPIREWRTKRNTDLTRRDTHSSKKNSETIAKAQRDIDDFYESYNRKTDKQKSETARQAEDFVKNRQDTTEGGGGTTWERIAKLTDLSGKGQGGGGEASTKRKMREILLDLKANKNAPGAGGV